MTTTATRSPAPTRQIAFDYDRTVVAFHGTRKSTAEKLVAGVSFDQSENDDDWLGHGIYFWEYAPQQAWWWAEKRCGNDSAVVGALVRFGRCIDLLDPSNADLLMRADRDLGLALKATNQTLKQNANNHKYRDCAVFNYLFETLRQANLETDSARAVFVPVVSKKRSQANLETDDKAPTGLPRLWPRSGVFRGAHIQLSVREPNNILAVWPVRKDGRYGKDP